MTKEELIKIKEYQREFKNLFNRNLEIDWELMNGVAKQISVKKLLYSSCKKFKADVSIIISGKKLMRGWTNEKLALRDFANTVIKNKLNIEEAAREIKKDRSIIYYYAGKR